MPKKNACPKCGGTKRGRGYSHKSGCSLIPASMKYRKKGGATRAKRRVAGRGRAQTTVSTGPRIKGLDLRVLKGMGIRSLFDLREKIDGMIKTKAPELRAEIKHLQKTLQTIKGR